MSTPTIGVVWTALVLAFVLGVAQGALPTNRITGGTAADDNTAMSLVYIEITSRDLTGKIFTFVCTGTVLSPTRVLTAAHCLHTDDDAFDVRKVQVWVNEPKKYGAPRYKARAYRIKHIDVHKQYDIDLLLNDLAMLTSEEPFDADEHPVVLASTDDKPVKWYNHLYAAGVGKIHDKGRMSRRLLEVPLRYRPFAFCLRRDAKPDRVDMSLSKTLCASARRFYHGGQDTCMGDGGGPLYMKRRRRNGTRYLLQVGITSYSTKNCGDRRSYTWYTNVATYASDIHRHLDGVFRDWDRKA